MGQVAWALFLGVSAFILIGYLVLGIVELVKKWKIDKKRNQRLTNSQLGDKFKPAKNWRAGAQ
jgi:hypothetical protein